MRNPSLFPLCWGALTLAALLGCATAPGLGVNPLQTLFSMPCNDQEARNAGYKQGRAGKPSDTSIMSHCGEQDPARLQTMQDAHAKAYERGAAELAQAKQEAYMRAQATACDADRAYQAGQRQGLAAQERDERVLEVCDLEDRRAIASKQFRRGYKQGVQEHQAQVCDTQKAYEQGYNAGVGGQQEDASYLDACTKSSRRRKAQRKYAAGFSVGLKEVRKDQLAAQRQQQLDQQARDAEDRRQAQLQALATCDRQEAHQRGYQDGSRGNPLDSSYITACPKRLARQEALDSYRVGYAEGRRGRVQQQRQAPAPRAPRARAVSGVLQNLTHQCADAGERSVLMFQVRVGNRKVDKVTLAPNRETSIALTPGTYDVDIYRVVRGAAQYAQSGRLDVASKRWTYWFGCKKQRAPKVRGPVAMRSANFETLMRQLKRESYAKGYLTTLKSAAAHNHFTSAQAKVILQGLTYDNDRVKAGQMLHPRVVDLNNWFVVYDAFTYDSGKTKLRGLVGQ